MRDPFTLPAGPERPSQTVARPWLATACATSAFHTHEEQRSAALPLPFEFLRKLFASWSFLQPSHFFPFPPPPPPTPTLLASAPSRLSLYTSSPCINRTTDWEHGRQHCNSECGLCSFFKLLGPVLCRVAKVKRFSDIAVIRPEVCPHSIVLPARREGTVIVLPARSSTSMFSTQQTLAAPTSKTKYNHF